MFDGCFGKIRHGYTVTNVGKCHEKSSRHACTHYQNKLNLLETIEKFLCHKKYKKTNTHLIKLYFNYPGLLVYCCIMIMIKSDVLARNYLSLIKCFPLEHAESFLLLQ